MNFVNKVCMSITVLYCALVSIEAVANKQKDIDCPAHLSTSTHLFSKHTTLSYIVAFWVITTSVVC